jgi:FkbM family methyltransferase
MYRSIHATIQNKLMLHQRFTIIGIAGFLCLFTLAVLRKGSTESPTVIFTANVERPIIYGNFTCDTWRNFSYIDEKKYQGCLGWGPDGGFWSVEGLRHTAHKGLLNASSLIVEVGGNRGHDTVKFIELYNATIISYEPLKDMCKNLSELFKYHSRAEFHPYGFGGRARSLKIEPNDAGNAGTSIFRPLTSPNSSLIVNIELLDVVQVLNKIRRTRTKDGIIDMLSINCEGCEFEILPALILNDMLQYFRIIQFASHTNLVPSASCIYCQIEQALERTHRVNYHYTMLWEGWVMRNDTNKTRAS